MKPQISVIMPVYNTPAIYLEPSANSVLAQKKELVELIIVDDGSTEKETLAFLDKISGTDNVQVYHIENGGVSNARNFGMDKANGEYIVFVDSDDALLENAAEKICENHKNADIVCFDYCKNYGDRVENIHYKNASQLFSDDECRRVLEDALVVENGLALCWGKAFKKDFLVQNGLLFNTELILAEDADFAIKCYSSAKTIYYLREIMYSYTLSVGSAVRKFKENMPEIYDKGMCRILSTVGKLNDEKLNIRAYNFVLYHLLIIVVNNVFHPENPLGFFAKFTRLKQICNYGCYKEALRHTDYSLFSKARAITLFFIKHNLYLPVYFIAKIRQSTRKD